MRRTLAAAFLAVTTLAAPALAEDPLKIVKDTIGECMDCIPSRCQILNNCEIRP